MHENDYTGELSVYDFGRQLIATGDLDPVYIVLWEAKLERELLWKYLVAYWSFYHMGTAAWITSHRDYWLAMEMAARSKTYPRCSERRHFRGQAAINSVLWLRERDIDGLVEKFDRAARERRVLTVQAVMKHVQQWVGFGKWIAFKVADMLERLDLCRVSFDGSEMLLFDSPKEGAQMLWEMEDTPMFAPNQTCCCEWAVARLLDELTDPVHGLPLAPPRYERPINSQECETILCKYKSYMKGHYHLGEDIDACLKALEKFPTCWLAKALQAAGHRAKMW
jgi:hypothetical protein